MDKAGGKSHYAPVGVSIRNGPVLDDKMDVDEPLTNGAAKRKARTSAGKTVNYNVDGTDSDEDSVPLVCQLPPLQL
jgi:DNA topoisomerase-1